MAGFSVGNPVSDLDGAVEGFSADVRIEDLDEAMVSFVVDERLAHGLSFEWAYQFLLPTGRKCKAYQEEKLHCPHMGHCYKGFSLSLSLCHHGRKVNH